MDASDLGVLTGSLAGGLVVAGTMLHWAVDDSRHALWPRGLRWLPPVVDRLEERLERAAVRLGWRTDTEIFRMSRRTRHLEGLDDAFRRAALLYGVWPEWTGPDDTHGYWRAYGREINTCPCGYVNECGIWCGDGHETGQCPEGHGFRAHVWDSVKEARSWLG